MPVLISVMMNSVRPGLAVANTSRNRANDSAGTSAFKSMPSSMRKPDIIHGSRPETQPRLRRVQRDAGHLAHMFRGGDLLGRGPPVAGELVELAQGFHSSTPMRHASSSPLSRPSRIRSMM